MARSSAVTAGEPQPCAPTLALVSHSRPTRPLPAYRRLTAEDVVEIWRLHKAGATQVAIAEVFGVAQATISRQLAKFDDSRALAKEYLAGQAFEMARSVVKQGQPSDHLAALHGLDVINPTEGSGLVVVIGCQDDRIQLGPLSK